MDQENAVKIAQSYILKINTENPYSDIMNWILTKPIKTDKGFYFNYSFELVNPEEPVAFGGAPGFIVSLNDGKIIDLSWEEYHALGIE